MRWPARWATCASSPNTCPTRASPSLRYDKVGTGKTGLGPYAQRPAEVGSAAYSTGARAAVRFLAGRPGTDDGADLRLRARRGHHPRHDAGRRYRPRCAEDPLAGAVPAAAGPLPGHHHRAGAGGRGGGRRPRVPRRPEQGKTRRWTPGPRRWPRPAPAAPHRRSCPTVSAAILNAGNVKAVVEADAIDPHGAGGEGTHRHRRCC